MLHFKNGSHSTKHFARSIVIASLFVLSKPAVINSLHPWYIQLVKHLFTWLGYSIASSLVYIFFGPTLHQLKRNSFLFPRNSVPVVAKEYWCVSWFCLFILLLICLPNSFLDACRTSGLAEPAIGGSPRLYYLISFCVALGWGFLSS